MPPEDMDENTTAGTPSPGARPKPGVPSASGTRSASRARARAGRAGTADREPGRTAEGYDSSDGVVRSYASGATGGPDGTSGAQDAAGAARRTGSTVGTEAVSSTDTVGGADGTVNADATGTVAGTDGAGGAGGADPKVAAAIAAAEAAGPGPGETVRIDSWIWAVRLIKTRSLGAAACRGGHVHVNGERVKPAYSLRVGDEVRMRHEGRERVVVVRRLIRKRVGAPVATQCYIDNSPPPPPRQAVAPIGLRDPGTGRPTKRDRRELERLRNLSSAGTARPPAARRSGGTGRSGGSGAR